MFEPQTRFGKWIAKTGARDGTTSTTSQGPNPKKLLGYAALVVVIAATDIAAVSIAAAIDATWLWFPLQMVFWCVLAIPYVLLHRRRRERSQAAVTPDSASSGEPR